jgi:hypothetical protein
MNQTTKITIDKGVPIPEIIREGFGGSRAGARRSIRGHDMEPGDSFFVPGGRETPIRTSGPARRRSSTLRHCH